LLGQSLYYLLTTGSGQQTLGEEYCDISQVATFHGLPPTPARRILFILYQTTVPYLAERICSRIVARSIALNESQLGDHPESDNSNSGIAQSTTHSDAPTRSLSVSALSRSRGQVHALWQWILQKWPSMLPFAQDFIQLAIRTNLMLFYFEGKRCAVYCKILLSFICIILRTSGLWICDGWVKTEEFSFSHILADHLKLRK